VLVLPVNVKNAAIRETGERLYRELEAAGFETLIDDRDERPGVKFKDADLLGIPVRVTVGALLAREGRVEVRGRREGRDVAVSPDEAVATVRELGARLQQDP
jgi:prolyl-tRNA synthetase